MHLNFELQWFQEYGCKSDLSNISADLTRFVRQVDNSNLSVLFFENSRCHCFCMGEITSFLKLSFAQKNANA